MAERATAIQLWEPAYTTLISKKPSIRTLDLKIGENWEKFAGSRNIPYLGVASHIAWAEKNAHLIPKLFATYKESADWIVANPDAAGKLINAKGTADDQKAVADLIRANERLGLNMRWASEVRREINAVYAAGRQINFLPADPAPTTIYEPKPK
jgi:NitT/TauT family transport system substrate-binding protein